MSTEFALIRQHFLQHGVHHRETRLGNGDDASVHHVPDGFELVISTDSALAGRHWPDDFPLQQAASRAMAAALSDLAAMGAAPRWAWLAVTLSAAAQAGAVGRGLRQTAAQYGVEIVGGDTTAGEQTAIHITVAGLCPQGKAMRRDQARPGDRVYLIGEVGLSAGGLQQWLQGQHDGELVPCFSTVVPQLAAGQQLVAQGVRCAIDVSDGLLQDAGHVARASGCDFRLHVERLPSLARLTRCFDTKQAIQLALTGGEDYALLLTAAPHVSVPAEAVCIGQCLAMQGRVGGVMICHHGQPLSLTYTGFDHFA